MFAAVAIVVLVLGVLTFRSSSASRPAAFTPESLRPVDPQLAAKAQDSCWFKVKSRSGRADQVRRWEAVSPAGASTMRLGDLLIVTGAIEPAVGDERFYGCSLFEYTTGSPVVMTTRTSSSPMRADTLIPLGFASDGTKQ
jgi:hypothetical protein